MKPKVIRQTVSLFPDDWAVVEHVERRYKSKRSQALRFIINDYRVRYNIPTPQPQEEPASAQSQES